MRVLITGGTGFIGSRLAGACMDAGDHVRVLAQTNTPAEEANARQLQTGGCDVMLGSVTDRQAAARAVDDREVIYHLAAAQHESHMPDRHFHAVNVEGTENMLRAASHAGVSRFVHGSTIGVYDARPGVTVHDNSPARPDNIYGVTKLQAEQLVQGYRDRLAVVIVRISEVYGPGDQRLLKLFRAIKHGRYFHIGKSDNLHHPIYIDDLVSALRRAATADCDSGLQVVAPGFEAVTTRQMVASIAEALGVRSPRWAVPLWPLWTAAVVCEKTLRPFGVQPPLHRRRMHFFVKSFQFSGNGALSTLGYHPRIGFNEGVRRTAEWYERNGTL